MLSLLAPPLFERLFNRFWPLPDPELAKELQELSVRAGVPVRTMLVADASRRTRKHNAYVSGLGPTRRLVLYDTLLEDVPRGELRGVVAHELGHRRFRHVASGTALGMLGAAAAVVILWLVLPWQGLLDAAGASGPGDPRVVPLVLLVLFVLELGALPFETWLSRRWERAADRFAVDLTGDGRGDRGDASPAGAREPRRPRPAAAPLHAPVHPPDPARADRRRPRENGQMSHEHSRDARRRALTIAFGLIVALLAGEVVFGIIAGSLALLADAGHMLTDAAALGLALVAASLAQRPARGRWTFGFRRLEILAAHINGITLLVVGVGIVYTAVWRLIDPPEVRGGIVLVVALVGIAVNLAAAAVLHGPSHGSLNVRGAFLHVATDLAAFVGTAIAGALILVTGWDRFDPIASLVVAALIFWSSFVLLRESTRILLDVAPRGADARSAEAMLAVPHVADVHDLHVWTVGERVPVAVGARPRRARRRLPCDPPRACDGC